MYKTTLRIDGMMCAMCEAHVNDAVRRVWKVKKVRSDHRKGEAEILTAEKQELNLLAEELEKTGYRILDAAQTPFEKKGLFGGRK